MAGRGENKGGHMAVSLLRGGENLSCPSVSGFPSDFPGMAAMASASGSALCFTDASSSPAIRRDLGSFCLPPSTITFGFVDKPIINLQRLRFLFLCYELI